MDAQRWTTLSVDRSREGVAVVTLDRPERLNAMTDTMFGELEELIAELRENLDLRAVIVTGAGRAFCAGYDLDDARELDSIGALAMLDRQERATRIGWELRDLPVPVLAAVNGAAAGGGFALALAADIRIASPDARFNCAFVRIGLSSGDMGTSWLLPKITNPAFAADMSYTGRFVDAEEAARVRLVNRVVPSAELLPCTLALAEQIRANSPGGVRLSKRALHSNLEISSFASARELENRGQALLTRGHDVAEALSAMRERRDPAFTGQWAELTTTTRRPET